MRGSLILSAIIFLTSFSVKSQNTITPAPPGFDVVIPGIPHGKLDTLTYRSKTVGTEVTTYDYASTGELMAVRLRLSR